ncbi:histone-binding protein RBBP4 [Cryptosporidium felis]|nr:histone-binding protein RBBP4 [Cryptosporidium felis]
MMNIMGRSSPFSTMMNFGFFDQAKKMLRTEESVKLEKYKIWKENTSLLYENIMTHVLEWPSLSVQWICDNDLSEIDGSLHETSNYSLLIGTHTSGTDQDYIIVLDVSLPNEPIPESSRKFETHNDYAGFSMPFKGTDSNRFKQRILIPHDGEVNRVLSSPLNTNIIASKSVNGDVNVYNINEVNPKNAIGPKIADKKPTLVLGGHESEGWALSWNKTNEYYLASGSDDTVICLWDINNREYNSIGKLEPIIKFKGHEKSVQDISWNPSNENIMISVGDDGLILLWDIRESSTPRCLFKAFKEVESNFGETKMAPNFKKVVGYNCIGYGDTNINSLNTIEFNPFRTDLIAVGGSDPVIALFDIRKMNRRLHSLNGHSGQINRLNFLIESESLLASASSDSTVSIWDLSKIGVEQRADEAEDGVPELIFTHSGHTSPVLDFSCITGKLPTSTFASISENNYLHIWSPGETIFFSDDEDEELERIKDIQVE